MSSANEGKLDLDESGLCMDFFRRAPERLTAYPEDGYSYTQFCFHYQQWQKTLELCAEVRSFGGALLSAIEKGDGEHLALMRQGHEIKIQFAGVNCTLSACPIHFCANSSTCA